MNRTIETVKENPQVRQALLKCLATRAKYQEYFDAITPHLDPERTVRTLEGLLASSDSPLKRREIAAKIAEFSTCGDALRQKARNEVGQFVTLLSETIDSLLEAAEQAAVRSHEARVAAEHSFFEAHGVLPEVTGVSRASAAVVNRIRDFKDAKNQPASRMALNIANRDVFSSVFDFFGGQ